MSPQVWMYVGIFSASLAVVLFILLLWRRRELRRYDAMKVYEEVAPWGIEPLNRILAAYAVGNYVGADSVLRTIREVIQSLRGDGIVAFVRNLGWKAVEGIFLKNDTDRTRLRTLLDSTEKAAASTVQPPAPTV